MPRLLLSDEHWSKLHKILLQKTIYDKPDLRMTVEAILYRIRTGCPWRDLPQAFGCWNRIYKRFNAWRSWSNLTWSGLLSMAVMPRHTSIALGLPVVTMKQSGKV